MTQAARFLSALCLCPLLAHGAVIAPPPGQSVVLLEERVILVFDPLIGAQTIVVQHHFEGTSTPFGLLLPTRKPGEAKVVSRRVRRALHRRLHPEGRVQRTLDIDVSSWAAGCAVRAIGDAHRPDGGGPEREPVQATPSQLGAVPDRLHDWLLENGFTIAPAQAAWLTKLRRNGWSIVAVVVRPPDDGGLPPARLEGPVLALTHPADEPIYAAGSPPFAIQGGPTGAKLEVSVLTEWAVDLTIDAAPEPFFADVLTRREVNQLAADAGGLPWAFKRDGTLTAWSLPAALQRPILRFARADPRDARRPAPRPQLREYQLDVPVEILILLLVLFFWAWRRFGRTRRGLGAQRI